MREDEGEILLPRSAVHVLVGRPRAHNHVSWLAPFVYKNLAAAEMLLQPARP